MENDTNRRNSSQAEKQKTLHKDEKIKTKQGSENGSYKLSDLIKIELKTEHKKG